MIEKVNNNYLADYYITKRSEKTGEYDTYNIIDKLKFVVGFSDHNLGDNIDIFISDSEFNGTKPSSHDMIFFNDEKKFYEVNKVDSSGDFYIVNVKYCKQKEV